MGTYEKTCLSFLPIMYDNERIIVRIFRAQVVMVMVPGQFADGYFADRTFCRPEGLFAK